VLTLFPDILEGVLGRSILGRAVEQGLIDINLVNIRDFADGPHRVTDEPPFGGGAGMVIKPEPVYRAVESLRGLNSLERIVLLTPQGRRLTQDIVKDMAASPDLVLVCGRYEGVDERIRTGLATDEISIGDYVLSGGEVPALVVIEAVSRMIPGVVGRRESVEEDSFYGGLLGYPQYTRPREFRGMAVPETLLSGDHERIRLWRMKQAVRRTLDRRPDMVETQRSEKEVLDLIKQVQTERDAGEVS
ncbi:MAG: tRNA (guanosine(37)-N1)-methyltransferase TrmD, partial [Candidatus Hydrogenedentes bacterium]|nr:tRNA (guanosine(37)-N1)-methyltransferase TrmD [Candidatus Hydrogenedentota bacterium]